MAKTLKTIKAASAQGVAGFIFGMIPATRWAAEYHNGSYNVTRDLVCWAAIVNEEQDRTEIMGMVLGDSNDVVAAKTIPGFVKYKYR